MSSIKVEKVKVDYGVDTVLEIDRLSINSPGLCVVTGPNGAGKSTLLRLFAGLQRPESGEVTIDGVKAHRRRARLTTGYSPDHPVLFDDLTIADNIAYAHESSGHETPTVFAEDMVEVFGLGELLKRFPSQLSRGQRQACSLAVMTSRPATVMIFDEPTLALDKDNRAHLASVMKAHAGDHTMLVASHESSLVDAADREIHLDDGRLVK